MNKKLHERIEIADRFDRPTPAAYLVMMGHDADTGRCVLVVDTGCSSAHIRMTKAEVMRLAAMLERAVETFPEAA